MLTISLTTKIFIMKADQLRKDYQNLAKQYSNDPKISEYDFVKLFLNKELDNINQALKTWSDKSKALYKSKYKRILKRFMCKQIESLAIFCNESALIITFSIT